MGIVKNAMAVGLFIASLSVASPALAQRWYVGGSLGSSDMDEDVAIGLITSGSVDGTDRGFKVVGGYQFNPYFAFELGYVDLGTAEYAGDYFGTPVLNGRLDVDGVSIGVVGLLPLHPNFSLLGKIGLFGWYAEARDITGGFGFYGDRDGSDLAYGVGLEFNVTPNFSLRAEWELFEVLDTDATLLSAGMVWKF